MNTLTYLIRQSHAQFWGVGVVKMTCLSSQWASQWGTRWFNPLSPKCYSGVWTNSHLSGSIWIFPLDQNCWGAMVMWSTYNLNGAFFFFFLFVVCLQTPVLGESFVLLWHIRHNLKSHLLFFMKPLAFYYGHLKTGYEIDRWFKNKKQELGDFECGVVLQKKENIQGVVVVWV